MSGRLEIAEIKTNQICLFIALHMYDCAGMRSAIEYKLLDSACSILKVELMGIRAIQALRSIKAGNLLTPKGVKETVDYARALVLLENCLKGEIEAK